MNKCHPSGGFSPKGDPEKGCSDAGRGFTEIDTNASSDLTPIYADPDMMVSYTYFQFKDPVHLRRQDPKGNLLLQDEKI